jgi:hypothetical protein
LDFLKEQVLHNPLALLNITFSLLKKQTCEPENLKTPVIVKQEKKN